MTARDSDGKIERASRASGGHQVWRGRDEVVVPVEVAGVEERPVTPETRGIAIAFVDGFKQRHGYEFGSLFDADLKSALEEKLDDIVEELNNEPHEDERGEPCAWLS